MPLFLLQLNRAASREMQVGDTFLSYTIPPNPARVRDNLRDLKDNPFAGCLLLHLKKQTTTVAWQLLPEILSSG